jgi:hypothetical protein
LNGWADTVFAVKEDFYGFECEEEEYDEPDDPIEWMLDKKN